MQTEAATKHIPKFAGAGIAARIDVVAKLAARPPRLAMMLQMAKKRPRSMTGIACPTMSIHAGKSAPDTPVIASRTASTRPSASVGARSATRKAVRASAR